MIAFYTALLGGWDWAFVGWFIAVTLGVGLWYSKRASANLDEYFLSGRKLPWWALGTSMVATTFAADTPIAVAGFVIAGGIAMNWFWWSFLFGGTLTVFVFARWWRRAEVVTEIELIARRYDGQPARLLRGFKAVFLGVVVNAIIFGFVMKAMSAICATVFDADPWVSLGILLALTFVYTMMSGLWGVVATDVLQFVMALLGAILLAVVAVNEVGGLDALVERVQGIQHGLAGAVDLATTAIGDLAEWKERCRVLGDQGVDLGATLLTEQSGFEQLPQQLAGLRGQHEVFAALSVENVQQFASFVERMQRLGDGFDIFSVFPTGWNLVTATVLILVFVNWWAVYYPGAEPGGGGYVAQRMSAALDENHARLGTLWFIFAHYVVRPWPWLLVGLAAIAVAPQYLLNLKGELGDFRSDAAYPGMFQYLPVGILGLVVASFFAAFMSTITTTLNLSSSYLVNDLYLPFLSKGDEASPRARVWVARAAVAVVTVIGVGVSIVLTSVGEGWGWIMHITAGVGPVLILRWIWWRINAWSEIAAMLASAAGMVLTKTTAIGEWLQQSTGGPKAELELLFIVCLSVSVWLPVTLMTKPVGDKQLDSFFQKVRPGGAWAAVATRCGLAPTRMGRDLKMWGVSTAMIFGALLGFGGVLLGETTQAVLWLGIAVAGGVALRLLFAAEARAKEAA